MMALPRTIAPPQQRSPMRIGIPTEIKNNEHRVGITPAGVDALVDRGHTVLVQAGAGEGSRITDDAYRAAGAVVVDDAATVWGDAELLVKVKEPIAAEYGYLRADQTLMTYLHLAADRPPDGRARRGGHAGDRLRDGAARRPLAAAAVADERGRRPPVDRGGRALAAARERRPRARSWAASPGVAPADVVVIGGGVAGEHAAANAHRPRRSRDRHRPLAAAPARAADALRHLDPHARLDAARHRGGRRRAPTS